jgi:hypothetical protein
VGRGALASGVVLGLVAGAISAFLVDTLIYYFVFPGITYPPLSQFWVNWTLLLLFITLLNLLIGLVSSAFFSDSHQSLHSHVPIRQGFKYGIAQPLPYIYMGLALSGYLNPFYLTVYYVAVLVLPIFLFGLVLVLAWNMKLGP